MAKFEEEDEFIERETMNEDHANISQTHSNFFISGILAFVAVVFMLVAFSLSWVIYARETQNGFVLSHSIITTIGFIACIIIGAIFMMTRSKIL